METPKRYIVTHSGEKFYYVDPMQSVIKIKDITHALARTPRFTTHTQGPWTVAQHSLLVGRMGKRYGPKAALAGLVHDFAEAYTGDINSPLKSLIKPLFGPIEKAVEAAIAVQLKLPVGEAYEFHDSETKLLDMTALWIEAEALIRGFTPEEWNMGKEYRPLPADKGIFRGLYRDLDSPELIQRVLEDELAYYLREVNRNVSDR